MKIHFLLKNLQEKLPFVTHAVSLKSQLPVLFNILLETKNGKLQCSATDLEIGIQVEISANIEEEGGITVPAKTFLELVTSLSGEKITIQTKNNTLEVVTPKTKSVLQTIPRDEFPRIYEDEGEEIIRISKEALKADFGKVVFAASTDTGRPALSGVLMKKNNTQGRVGLLLVATDGYRLSLKHHATMVKEGKTEKQRESVLIPARVIREAISLKQEDEDVGVSISGKNNQILFRQSDAVLVGRVIEAEFPQFEKIIPTDFNTRVTFDKDEMQKAVKMCAIFARDSANIIKFSIRKDKIVVSANTPSVGENHVEVDAQVSGEENEIAFNVRYLLDLFANLEEESIVFEMTGPLNPGVFKIKDDDSFLHLIMPIRIQNTA